MGGTWRRSSAFSRSFSARQRVRNCIPAKTANANSSRFKSQSLRLIRSKGPAAIAADVTRVLQPSRSSLGNQLARHQRRYRQPYLNVLLLIVSAHDADLVGSQNLRLAAKRRQQIHQLLDAAVERYRGPDLAIVVAYSLPAGPLQAAHIDSVRFADGLGNFGELRPRLCFRIR